MSQQDLGAEFRSQGKCAATSKTPDGCTTFYCQLPIGHDEAHLNGVKANIERERGIRCSGPWQEYLAPAAPAAAAGEAIMEALGGPVASDADDARASAAALMKGKRKPEEAAPGAGGEGELRREVERIVWGIEWPVDPDDPEGDCSWEEAQEYEEEHHGAVARVKDAARRIFNACERQWTSPVVARLQTERDALEAQLAVMRAAWDERHLRGLLEELGNAEVQVSACYSLRQQGIRNEYEYAARVTSRDRAVEAVVSYVRAALAPPAAESAGEVGA